jgi:hypothetical protein
MSAPDEALTAALAAASVDDNDFFPFAALPPALALQIFAALPADTRLRCAEVCRDWRTTVAERSLWTRLDLSRKSGVTHRVTPALLRAAASKAGGALTALDVSGVRQLLTADGVLRDVLAANAGTLRELRCVRGREQGWMSVPVLENLLSAAPQLRVCEADVASHDIADARRALRNEGVFGPLRLQSVFLGLRDAEAATLLPLFADVAAHGALSELLVAHAAFEVPALLDAFVDAALSLPLLRTVRLLACSLSPTSAPPLARLLGSSMLTELNIQDDNQVLLDAPAGMLLGDALRANATLTALTLHRTHLWTDHAAAAALLGALTGHASLRQLRIMFDVAGALLLEENRLHAGALLGALVAADAPALTALTVSNSLLSDDGLRPLFEALPANSHLQELDCSYNEMSEAFARDVLLPAVRANTSLRTLTTHAYYEQQPRAARQAAAHVARCNGQGEAALV